MSGNLDAGHPACLEETALLERGERRRFAGTVRHVGGAEGGAKLETLRRLT